MKAEELRIGNLVEAYIEPQVSEWIEIEVGVETLGLMESKPESHGYRPIPLTEEWLLKFGGIKRFSKRSNIIDITINEETDIVFPFSNTDMIPFIETYQENYNKEGGDQTIITLINLKHVHQLQNLFFALTGEELKVKL